MLKRIENEEIIDLQIVDATDVTFTYYVGNYKETSVVFEYHDASSKEFVNILTPEEISRFPIGQLFCDILVGPDKDTHKLDYWICGDPAYNQLLKLVESQIPEIKVELHNQIEEMIGEAQSVLDADMDHIEELVGDFDVRASDATYELEEKVNSLDSLIVEKVDLAINNLLEATY